MKLQNKSAVSKPKKMEPMEHESDPLQGKTDEIFTETEKNTQKGMEPTVNESDPLQDKSHEIFVEAEKTTQDETEPNVYESDPLQDKPDEIFVEAEKTIQDETGPNVYETDPLQDKLDEIFAEAERTALGELAQFELVLNEIEESLRQSVQAVRDQVVCDKEEALVLLRQKLDRSYVSPLVAPKVQAEFEETLTSCVKIINDGFSSNKWINVQLQPIVMEKILPKISYHPNRVDQEIEKFINLQLLNLTDHSVDPFLVEVCHVLDPGEFYLHRFCDEKRRMAVDKLLKLESIKTPSEIVAGRMYAVYVENLITFKGLLRGWFRGQCLKQCGNFHVGSGPSQALYEVFIVDHGCYERVPSLKFGLLPKELLKLEPLALPCCIQNVTDAPWSPNAVEVFKRLARHSPLNLFVVKEEGGLLTVDLSQIPHKADDANSPSFLDSMMMLQPRPVRVRTPLVSLRPSLTGIETGMMLQGKVFEIVSPFKIFVDFNDPNARQPFESLIADLQIDCNSYDADVRLAVHEPIIGE